MNPQNTLNKAIIANQNNLLEEWVQSYLLSDGNNKKLAQHLKDAPIHSTALWLYPLQELK